MWRWVPILNIIKYSEVLILLGFFNTSHFTFLVFEKNVLMTSVEDYAYFKISLSKGQRPCRRLECLEEGESRDWFPIAMTTAIKGSSQVMPVDNGIKHGDFQKNSLIWTPHCAFTIAMSGRPSLSLSLVMTELLQIGKTLRLSWNEIEIPVEWLWSRRAALRVMKSQRTRGSFRGLKESITYPGAVLGSCYGRCWER
ncbi:Hypothetical predicted protein [Marmota monax]|uniref:Uncharacterized protein n=1 Tax=Marmota monax TaxID=9995 RepID=A0A5E4D7C5_MARMO|nr:Hypothetical predicted protein [Marmota monax]